MEKNMLLKRIDIHAIRFVANTISETYRESLKQMKSYLQI